MGLTQVSTDGVKNDAITKTKIPANQIEASELADNAVDTNAIADQAVDLTKLPHGTSDNDGKFLRANNGADPSFETVSIPAGTTINSNTNNQVITATGTANTLQGESNLLFTGTNLGIGDRTSSPDELVHAHASSGEAKIHIEGATNARLKIRAHSGESIVAFGDAGSSNPGEINYTHSSDAMSFRTNGSVRALIDSSGNVGIGETTAADNRIKSTSPHAYNVVAKSSNGNGGYENFTGLTSSGNKTFYVTHNGRVGAADGIIFGSDTAADNLLHDYEEGTHTLGPNSNLTLNASYNVGQYTKVGNVVTMTFLFFISSVSSNNQVTCTLPFPAKSGSGSSRCDAIGSVMHNGVNTGSAGIVSYIGNGSSEIQFYNLSTNGGWTALNNSDLNANDEMYVTVVYRTA